MTRDADYRPRPPLQGDELSTLLGFLDLQRATLEWKTRDLGVDGLGAHLHPTTMTLGGLLKHLAQVEDTWFAVRLHGRAPSEPLMPDGDWDWAWRTAAEDSPEQLRAWWSQAVARSRDRVAEALADGGLDRPARVPRRDGRTPSLRWILVHMLEEYARHNGHADLLREAVDGRTGA